MSTNKCVLCDKNLKNSKRTNVGAAGLANLIDISSKRGDIRVNNIFRSVNSIQLHSKCRNKYVIIDYCLIIDYIPMMGFIRINSLCCRYVSQIEPLSKNVLKWDNECDEQIQVGETLDVDETLEVFGEIEMMVEESPAEITEVDRHSEDVVELASNNDRNFAFERTCIYMKESDDIEFKIQELQAKMQYYLPPPFEPYSTR